MLQKYVIIALGGEDIVRKFYQKELKKTNPKDFKFPNQSKEKVIYYMLHGTNVIILLIVGLI